jgi:D-glycero-alpha-D-manno-heptose-7-phosphate kinase
MPFIGASAGGTISSRLVERFPASRVVTARAPTRIDLGGGWTDVPPYCDEQGGYVCNVAIDRHAVATVRAETYRGATGQGGGDSPVLVEAALRRTHTTGVVVEIESHFPVGAGLGGSSSASAAVFGALAAWNGTPMDRTWIAEEGRRVEVEEMGISGGRQDHYAATYGGALGLTFTTATGVARLDVSNETFAEFERRGILIYTGESRISGRTITAVLDAYHARVPRVCDALAAMKRLARQMAGALTDGDLDTLGGLVAEHWEHQRSLDAAIPTDRIDAIVGAARRAGACGWKATGASGGGCVFVIAGVDNADHVRAAIAPLGELVPFSVDREGLTIA